MDIVLIATIITVSLALLFDFTNGFHDAANATSTVIATKSLKPRTAVIVSSIFNFLPAFVVGTAVANTISKTVSIDKLPEVAAGAVPYGIRVTLAALLGAIFWNYFTWSLGLPSSSSHALIGGLIGAGLSAGGTDVISWDKVKTTAEAIVASPAIAFFIAMIAMWLVRLIQKIFSIDENSEFFRWGQVGSSAWLSWAHGSNDAQKTMGVIAATLYAGGYLQASDSSSLQPTTWVIFGAHLAIAAGTIWGGWRIIETMGLKITRISRASGFAANIGAITAIEGATYSGIPISTTHAAASSVTGSGVGAGRPVHWGVMRNMAFAWVVTLPAGATVAYFVFKLTVLPGIWSVITTLAAILGLLVWAGRLMLHADTAADIARKVEEGEEIVGTGFGFQVSQASDEEIAQSSQDPPAPIRKEDSSN